MATSGSNIFTAMYANMGMYYSSNDGNTWTRKSGCSFLINTLFSFNGKLFIGTFNNGLYVAPNDGLGSVYHVLVNGIDPCIYSFTASGSKLFAASVNNIYVSTDGGSAWIGTGAGSYTFQSLCTSGSVIFAGTSSNGVMVSTNDGVNWVTRNSGLSNLNVTSITSIGSNIFAATYGGGVFVSTNSGITWSAVSSGLLCNKINYLFTKDNVLFACADSAGVFSTTNNGSLWTKVFNGIPNTQIYTGCSKGTFVFVGCYSSGVFRSPNYGNTWSEAGSGIMSMDICGLTNIGTNLFACTLRGIYRSTDNGDTWVLKNNEITNFSLKTVYSSGNTLYVGCGYGGNHPHKIYKSTNLGDNWSVIMSNPNLEVNTILNVGTDLWAGTSSGIYVTTNNGVNWTSKFNGSSFSLIQKGSSLFTGSYGVFKSTDYGNTWQQVASYSNIRELCSFGPNIFVAVSNNVYRSSDEGTTWVSALNASINSFSIYGSNIFAFASNTFVSANGGVNWTQIQGTLGSTINYGAITGNFVFAGASYSSVWKRPISDFVGINCISKEIPSSFALYQNYPNPFNPSTKIRFAVSENCETKIENGLVTLKVYDILGKEIATLVNENLQPGIYEIPFSNSQISNNKTSSGIYFYTLISGSFKETKRMVLLK